MASTRAVRVGIAGSLVLLCSFSLFAAPQASAPQPPAARQREPADPDQQDRPSPAQPTSQPRPPGDRSGPSRDARPDPGPARRGLILNTDAAFSGYTLFAPERSTTTYLIDMKGEVVHSWPSRYVPGEAVYLLEDGSLLRCAREPGNRHFGGGGIGGRVERIAPDGEVQWEFVYADEDHCLHHDIKPLPNDHVLMIAWEKKTRDQAIAAGRDPEQITGEELWPDCIIEVEPQGASGGKIVWEWHVWDHLVQSFDPTKPNYGVVTEHPELVDLNYRRSAPRETPAEIRRLRGLGYVGGAEPEADEDGGRPPRRGPGGFDMRADWCHTNSLDYNARLDQIALSVHAFNEIWIIDHSTSTREAAGHSGGRYGKGGDLLYRWGNPRAYGAGTGKDQTLFAQHDVRWIPDGSPGAGHLMVFNNGPGRPGGPYSSVVEIAPPIDSAGRYRLTGGKAFEPSKPTWEYTAPNKADFFAGHISGAERLPNGNTLICSGEQGRLFEVDADGKTVWEYINPHFERNLPGEGFGPFGGGPDGRRFRDQRPDAPGPVSPPPGGAAGDGARGMPGPTSRFQDGAGADREGPGDADAVKRSEDETRRPEGRRPPWGPPGAGPWGPPGLGPGRPPGGGPGRPPGGGPGAGLFRATRLAPDHPGVRRLLEASRAK